MESKWIIIAGCCAIIAGVLLLIGKTDGAFVTGAIGVLAWFLNLRRDLRKDARVIETVSAPESDSLGEQNED